MSKASIKLQQIQCELVAPKNLENKFGGYRYRSAEGILEAVKPHLEKHQAILTVTDEMVEIGGRVYVKATATFMADDQTIATTAFAREPESRKGMDDAQVTGATSSYARKYALNGLFCIDDTKDADALNDGSKAAPEAKDTMLDNIIAAFNLQTTMEGLDAKLAKAKGTVYKDDQRMLDAYNRKANELNSK